MIDRRMRFLTWKSEHGLTLTAIAAVMQLDLGHVSKVASGKRPMSDAFMGRFAQVYGHATAGRLFEDDGDGEASCTR